MSTREHTRLQQIQDDIRGWRRWGPYVGDRSWGTVREDYSSDGNAWNYLPHDLARSKAYRWGEDGIAGICDRYQLLVFAPAFWNGHDPILKERLFGLTPNEGNHGEDVKEYYFHLDNTPTHSYMKFLYKYPQAEFPYGRLIGGEPPPRRPGLRVRAARHRRLRRGPLLRHLHRVRQERRRKTSASASRRSTAAQRRRRCTSCRICGFATPGAGRRCPARSRASASALPAADCAEPGQPTTPPSKRSATFRCSTGWGRARSTPLPAAALLFTNNETNGERVFGPGSVSRTPLRQGRLPSSRHPRRRLPQPGAGRHQGGATLSLRRARGRLGGAAAAPLRRGRPGASRSPRSTPIVNRRRRRPTSSTPRSTPPRRPRTNAASSARRSPVCCGPSRATSSTCSAGSRATSPTVRRQPTAPAHPQSALAPPQLDARHDDAGQVGVPLVRRLGPGLSLRRLRAGRSGLRQGPALGAAVRAVPASQRSDSRPTNGSSPT